MKKFTILLGLVFMASPVMASQVAIYDTNTDSSIYKDDAYWAEKEAARKAEYERMMLKKEEMRKAEMERLRLKKEAIDAKIMGGIRNFSTTTKKVEERREELKAKIEAKKEEFKEKREEKIEQVKQKASERLSKGYEKVFEGFDNAAERLAEHFDKIEARIAEFEAKGRDLTVAKEKLAIAETKITALPSVIDAAQSAVAGIIAGTAEDKLVAIKAEVSKAKTALKEAHTALVDTIREIKNTGGNSDKATTTPTE